MIDAFTLVGGSVPIDTKTPITLAHAFYDEWFVVLVSLLQ